MEYSVYDLVRILLKKWYIVVLIMLLVAGLSVVTSQVSYANALEQYHAMTSEKVPVIAETGTTTGIYKLCFVSDDTPSVWTLLGDETILANTQQEIANLNLQEPPTINGDGVVTPSAGPLVVENHISLQIMPQDTLQITVAGLEEEAAQEIINSFLRQLQRATEAIGGIEEQSVLYTQDPPQLTSTAQFALMVMKEPQSPNMIKTVGTAAAYAFVLGCFAVLLATFIKETNPRRKSA